MLINGPTKFSRRSFRVSVTGLAAAAALQVLRPIVRNLPGNFKSVAAQGRVSFVGDHDKKRLILHTLKKGDEL